MSKLSLDALQERAGVVASEELLNTISGGTQSACHDNNFRYEHTGNALWDPIQAVLSYIF